MVSVSICGHLCHPQQPPPSLPPLLVHHGPEGGRDCDLGCAWGGQQDPFLRRDSSIADRCTAPSLASEALPAACL